MNKYNELIAKILEASENHKRIYYVDSDWAYVSLLDCAVSIDTDGDIVLEEN